MLSDGKIISKRLHKGACQVCGYGFHATPPTQGDLRDFFDNEYDLGQRDPDAEKARAELYANAIELFLSENKVPSPQRIVEPGCGMGSLLSRLAHGWGCEAALGVEPSQQLADIAREQVNDTTEVWQGFAEDIADTHKGRFDLCLSINVIEHTLSPDDFMDVCRKITHVDGHILIVCPDGETPNLELLFYDHISSFTRPALDAFARRAGLSIVASRILEGPLLGFQMLLLKRSAGQRVLFQCPPHLTQARVNLLDVWRKGSDNLEAVLAGRPYAIFGAGEFADLLAAYCARIVENAQSFVVDTPSQKTYLGKPIVSTEEFLKLSDNALVAAVNERSWPVVKERFADLGRDIYHPQKSLPNG